MKNIKQNNREHVSNTILLTSICATFVIMSFGSFMTDVSAHETSVENSIIKETQTQTQIQIPNDQGVQDKRIQNLNSVQKMREKTLENRKEIVENTKEKVTDIRSRAQNDIEIIKNTNQNSQEIKTIQYTVKTDLQDNRNEAILKRTENVKTSTESLKENREKFRSNVDLQRIELEKRIKSLKEERKNEKTKKIEGDSKLKVLKSVDSIFARLNLRIDRITKTDIRLSERIIAQNEQGDDTTQVIALYASAQQTLSTAKASVEAAKLSATSETNIKTSNIVYRDIVKSVEENIKKSADAYKKVLEAIVSLPKLNETLDVNSTPEPSSDISQVVPVTF